MAEPKYTKLAAHQWTLCADAMEEWLDSEFDTDELIDAVLKEKPEATSELAKLAQLRDTIHKMRGWAHKLGEEQD